VKRICVVTAGHLATCPRMLKAADALHEAGYGVRVVSTCFSPWARAADGTVRTGRDWSWAVVDYDKQSGRATYWRSGLRQRASRMLARVAGPGRCPLPVAACAYSRVHSELVKAIVAQPADLVYGGGGAFAAASAAARRTGVPYAVDLEDFHSAEQNGTRDAALSNGLAGRIERDVLRRAYFVTAASAAITAAYRETYDVQPITVNNTFPLPAVAPDLTPPVHAGLRLYWFSQTIGPGRGLEDLIHAMGRARITGEIHLRGQPWADYLGTLQQLAAAAAPAVQIVHHDVAHPAAMLDLCRGYDAGLAVEPGFSRNNLLALSNKALTYILAGLPVVLTDTPGQHALAEDLGEGAIVYRSGDIDALAAGLARWAGDKAQLAAAKAAAWEAAKRRWHWEHPAERGALLAAVRDVVG
jgi:glycosyltransferase involved in cell wall biosynthesis